MYLAFLKIAVLRFATPSYSLYILLCAVAGEQIDKCKQNPYVLRGDVSEYHFTLLNALQLPMSRGEFLEFAEKIKRIGL